MEDHPDNEFKKLIDNIVISCDNDQELADGIRWIDAQANEKGIGFYDMAMMILRKHLAERRAKEWLEHKND